MTTMKKVKSLKSTTKAIKVGKTSPKSKDGPLHSKNKKSKNNANKKNFSRKKFALKKDKSNPYTPEVDDEDNNSEIQAGDDDFDDMNDATKWYERFSSVKSYTYSEQSLDIQSSLKREAGAVFTAEVGTSASRAPKTIPKTDFKWIKKVVVQGTLNDKIAAYVLLIQDDPIANINHIKNMVSMIKVGKKRECFMTMDTLVQLFLDDLLPPDRKLVPFNRQPLAYIDEITSRDLDNRRQLLLLWFFEDQLKQIYSTFVGALNEAVHDSVEANKASVITALCKLLSGHPEQESVILSHVVNKLGDPSPKIGSKVIYCLSKLLGTHPAMKGVIMEEVERVIFRPNINRRAQYYAICFLTQFTFHADEGKLAAGLISIYFSLFKACIKTGDIDSRMMSALLTGVNRAYPFAKSECVSLKEHVDTLYKVVHLSGTNVAIHALCLMHLITKEESCDRFMTVLYKKIGDPSMYLAAHHAMFLSLIFKAIKQDKDNGRICAFIKRLFQVAVQLPVPLICGILMLISEVIHSCKKNLKIKMEQAASKENKTFDDDDDGEEKYTDQVVNQETISEIGSDSDGDDEKKTEIAGSWYHLASKKPKTEISGAKSYDPYQRNPLYSSGDTAVPVELVQFCRHFHPTVALFADNIIKGIKVKYTGDPLQDFSLIRFLDKFVFKNPKKISTEEATFSTFARKKYYTSSGVKRLRANTKEYLALDLKNIPVDETFMYKYLKEKSEGRDITRVKEENGEASDDDDSDADSLNDEEFDAIMKGMGGNQQDLDFMNEIGKLTTSEKKSAGDEDGSENEGDSNDDFADDNEDEDGEMNAADDDDLQDEMSDAGSFAEDFDGDEIDDFSDGAELDSDPDEFSPPKAKKMRSSSKPGKGGGSFFAAAEEFSELLEADSYKAGTSSALSNKDNAGVKQLKWEVNRNSWMKGKNKRPGKFNTKKSKNSTSKFTKGVPKRQNNIRKRR